MRILKYILQQWVFHKHKSLKVNAYFHFNSLENDIIFGWKGVRDERGGVNHLSLSLRDIERKEMETIGDRRKINRFKFCLKNA